MRLLRLALLTATVAASAGVASAQLPGGGPPGGFSGGRGMERGGPPGGFSGGRSSFSMDPNERFNQMSGGKDSFNVNALPPDQKERLVRFAPMMGLQIPPDGNVTRQMYTAASEGMRQRMQQGGGMMFGRGGPPGMGGPPGGMTMTMTAPGGAPGTPGAPSFTPSPSGGPPGFPGSPGGFGGDRGRGGFDPNSMPDDQIRQFMSRYDQDGDGRISQVEAQRSDRIRDNFATYDVNRDGFIDLSEYRGYLISRMSPSSSSPGQTPGSPPQWGGQPTWGTPPGSFPGAPGTVPGQTPPPAEDPRPVVFRFGKLPKEFPYQDLDEDKDGQVGLYEWKAASKALAEFKELDLNRDGFLTAEEFLRARPPAAPSSGDRTPSLADTASSSSDRSDRRDRGSNRDRKDEKRDEKKEEKRQPGGNPFSRNR